MGTHILLVEILNAVAAGCPSTPKSQVVEGESHDLELANSLTRRPSKPNILARNRTAVSVSRYPPFHEPITMR